jgi:hypothetical protein
MFSRQLATHLKALPRRAALDRALPLTQSSFASPLQSVRAARPLSTTRRLYESVQSESHKAKEEPAPEAPLSAEAEQKVALEAKVKDLEVSLDLQTSLPGLKLILGRKTVYTFKQKFRH